MREKPRVCLIDEDPLVREGWLRSLRKEADLDYFPDHLELVKKAGKGPEALAGYACIIMGRFFQALGLDIVSSPVPDTLRASGAPPIFLNWQGFVSKEELHFKFDGKLYHKYGVRWQTLRLRLQKQKAYRELPEALARSLGTHSRIRLANRSERCRALLKKMAITADGSHKKKIEFYLSRDPSTGIELLEAIYNRLVTDKNCPSSCPSKYINSSPVIAQRILREALFAD